MRVLRLGRILAVLSFMLAVSGYPPRAVAAAVDLDPVAPAAYSYDGSAPAYSSVTTVGGGGSTQAVWHVDTGAGFTYDFASNPVATNTLSDDIVRLADGHLTGSGETVLGHYADDYIGLAQSRGASYFDIGDAWDGLSDAQRWAANQRVLDTAIANGDRITLATNRLSIRPGSALAREIDYLTGPAGGYVWLDDVTLVPGG